MDEDKLAAALVRLIDLQQQTVELLESLPGRIAAAGRANAPGLSREDRAALSTFLPLVFEEVGTRVWTLGDLARDKPDAHAAMLLTVAGSASPERRLGKLLARAHGLAVDGLTVQRMGEVRKVALWKVRPA